MFEFYSPHFPLFPHNNLVFNMHLIKWKSEIQIGSSPLSVDGLKSQNLTSVYSFNYLVGLEKSSKCLKNDGTQIKSNGLWLKKMESTHKN